MAVAVTIDSFFQSSLMQTVRRAPKYRTGSLSIGLAGSWPPINGCENQVFAPIFAEADKTAPCRVQAALSLKRGSAAVSSVELGEYRVSYVSQGKGPSMILLHGSDKREDWSVWTPLLELSDNYSLVMPDLVGFGKSSRPAETPDYVAQAKVLHELVDKLSIQKATLVGTSWGGQVALEFAINWPERVDSMVLISSTYDKSQLPRLKKARRPTLIIWAEDDLVAQVKAGYLLRDAIGTSRIQVLDAVAKNPGHDFTIAHKLERYRTDVIVSGIRDFLSDPENKVVEPPELEAELRGLAMKEEKGNEGRAST